LPRSGFYYEPTPAESVENLALMRDIDRLYMRYQFYGAPRLTVALRAQGQVVNEKRVARLMRVMGIQAIVPGPHTSRPHPAHRVFPYLLRGLLVSASNTHLIPLRSLRHTNAASPLCLFVQPQIRYFVILQSRRTPLHAGFVFTGDSVRRRRTVQLLHLGIIAVDRLHGAGLQAAGATAAVHVEAGMQIAAHEQAVGYKRMQAGLKSLYSPKVSMAMPVPGFDSHPKLAALVTQEPLFCALAFSCDYGLRCEPHPIETLVEPIRTSVKVLEGHGR
jgi:hypothetical protein